MRLAYIGSVAEPVTTTPGDPGGDRYALFPGVPEASTTADDDDFSYYPKRFSLEKMMEMWWRVLAWNCNFTLDVPGVTFEAGDVRLDFVGGAPDETRGAGLQYFKWQGTYDVTVGPQIRTITFSVALFVDELDAGAIPAYYWRTNTAPPTVVPRLEIQVSAVLDFGVEFGMNGSTRPQPSSPGPFFFTQAIGFNGETLYVWADPNLAASLTMDISGLEWFEYRDSSGLNPVWDAGTGTQLLQVTPIYTGNAPV